MINVTNEMLIDVVSDALTGKRESLLMRLRIMAKKLKKESPELAGKLEDLLINTGGAIAVERANPVVPKITPVDADTRQKLLVETYPVVIDVEPVWPTKTDVQLNRFVAEWEMKERLYKEGLHPSKSLLMGGPPGVGKTLAAKWLAFKLDMPLLTLDLASVMSSYLGKTGNNIKAVLNYASSSAMKILVRENIASLRATDERLLLACGANMVIPWNAPLSRCLTMIESVQGQKFSRYVPEDIPTLLSMTQPLKLRGFPRPSASFFARIEAVINGIESTVAVISRVA